MSERFTVRPLMVGFDGSPQSHDALALAVALARSTGDPLLLVCAYGPDGVLERELARRRTEAQERLALAVDALPADAELTVEWRAVPGSSAPAVLHELAEAEHPRAVVLGSCHRGRVGRVLAGSVAERLLHGSPCPVAVAPLRLSEGPVAPLRTVGVGFDRGPEGWNALQRAAQLAAAAGAQLRIMLVLEPLTAFPATAALTDELAVDRRSLAEIELRRAAESVSQRLRPETRLLRGDPIGRLDIEAHDVDLLVLGSRDYGPVRRVLLGSVSTALVRSAASPVMVVPRSVEFAPEGEGMAAEDELLRADIGR